MDVKLSRDEFRLLAEGCFLIPSLLGNVRAATFNGKTHVLHVSDEEAELIRDACGDELQKRGFGAGYEPNATGILLEGMIDKFFVG